MLDKRNYFISFNSADLDYATAINTALRAAGKTTHFHPTDIEHGHSIMGWMRNALPAAEQVMGICSPDYFKDEAEYSELERLVTQWGDPLGWEKKLLYVEVKPTDYNPFDDHLKRITETSGMLPDAAADKLIEVLDRAEFIQREKDEATASALPEIHNFRRPRTLDFTGRDQALADLHRTLSQGNQAAITQVVGGMGGIGKTTLATEYVHRFGTRAHYAGLWWINAETSLLQDLADLAGFWSACTQPENHIPKSNNLTEQARNVVTWLAARNKPWLLIFDNVENPDQIRGWLPGGAVRVIITSRYSDWSGMAQDMKMQEWDLDTTTDFLLAKSSREDRDGAHALAKELNGLPLAADQAVAFLGEHSGVSFQQYARDIHEVIEIERPEGNKGGYEDTVYATLSKSITTLPQETQDLLYLTSWLSPDGVRVDLLVETAEKIPDLIPDPLGAALRGKYTVGPLVSRAERLALLQTAGQGAEFSLKAHRMTQTVLRRMQQAPKQQSWEADAIGMLHAVFEYQKGSPDKDPAIWERYRSLLPHVESLMRHTDPKGEAAEQMCIILNQAGGYLSHVQGDIQGAIAMFERIVDLVAEAHGTQRTRYTTYLSNLANLYIEIGRLDDAEKALEFVLEIETEIFGAKHPKIAHRLNIMGRISRRRGHYKTAEEQYTRALGIFEAAHGDASSEAAASLSGLAMVHEEWANVPGQGRGRRVKALALNTRALAAFRASEGERHPAVATTLHDFAIISGHSGDLEAAVRAALRGIAILISLGQDDAPVTQRRKKDLNNMLMQSGLQASEAELRITLYCVIYEVESEMATWVNEDPDNRHFGPKSFFADKPEELGFAKNALGIEGD